MKKSLLALAVLGAFTGIASAQTSVTIYGVADVGITRQDNGATVTNRLDSGNQSGSRLGFKGTEDLGGGLSGQFVLEQGFNIDTGSVASATNNAFNRQAYLGLTGPFGQLRLGRQKTVMYDALDAIDPFRISNRSGMDRLFLRNTGGASRADNQISYFTPTFVPGLTGQITYALGEQTNNQAGRSMGASLNYAAGPLFVTLDYLLIHNNFATGVIPGSVPAALFPDQTARSTLAGATYDFGIVKAHAAVGIEKGGFAGLNRATDARDYMLGATVPFGASAVQVSALKKQDRIGNGDAKQYAAGYTYALSKRTNFYSSYTHTDQEAIAYVAGTLPNQIDRVVNVGVRHTF
ncbi:MAG: porin [Pseudomonadota bacterium]